MSRIDENLLMKLVDRFGLDKEQVSKTRSRLWFKLTKEYNQITDNNISKAKMVKKWQNVEYRKRCKESKGNGGSTDLPTEKVSKDGMWNIFDSCLRDLFLYLIDKHGLEFINHPRVKSRIWNDLSEEFHSLIGNCVVLRVEKLQKKWQNWKAYNKNRNLPHPLESHKHRIDFDLIRAKLFKLRDKLLVDKVFAARLAQEGDLTESVINEDGVDSQLVNIEASKEEPEASLKSEGRRLEKQLALKMLRNESEKMKVILENGDLERKKIKMEIELVEVKLQNAKADLALKKFEMEKRGISLENLK